MTNLCEFPCENQGARPCTKASSTLVLETCTGLQSNDAFLDLIQTHTSTELLCLVSTNKRTHDWPPAVLGHEQAKKESTYYGAGGKGVDICSSTGRFIWQRIHIVHEQSEGILNFRAVMYAIFSFFPEPFYNFANSWHLQRYASSRNARTCVLMNASSFSLEPPPAVHKSKVLICAMYLQQPIPTHMPPDRIYNNELGCVSQVRYFDFAVLRLYQERQRPLIYCSLIYIKRHTQQSKGPFWQA